MDTYDSYLDFRGVLVHYVYQFQFRKQEGFRDVSETSLVRNG